MAVRIGAKIRSYWPGDETRKFYKFRAAFDYYKSRSGSNGSGMSNTRSCEVEKELFVDDSRVKRQQIRRRRKIENDQKSGENGTTEAKDRKYPLYTDIFVDYEPQIPRIHSDLFNLAFKRHKMGQIHKWIFPLMNTVSCDEHYNSSRLIRILENK